MSVNKVILIGNLGTDPEVKRVDNGTAVANFSLATSETYKDRNGEKVTKTEWHNIVLWKGLAEIAEKYVKKGTRIYLEGKLRTRSWDDKDGNKRYTTEIVGDVMQMLGDKSNTNTGHRQQSQASTQTESPDTTSNIIDDLKEDDLPF